MQNAVHTTEPLAPQSGPFEIEFPIEKLKTCKLPGIDQIPAELVQAGGKILRSKTHKRINSIWNNYLGSSLRIST
jgi:hypothetical protein